MRAGLTIKNALIGLLALLACAATSVSAACDGRMAVFSTMQILQYPSKRIVGDIRITAFSNDTIVLNINTVAGVYVKHMLMHVGNSRSEIPMNGVSGSGNFAAYQYQTHLNANTRSFSYSMTIADAGESCCTGSSLRKLFAWVAYAADTDQTVPTTLLVMNAYRLGTDLASGTFMLFPSKCDHVE